jgi:hypothetical protein
VWERVSSEMDVNLISPEKREVPPDGMKSESLNKAVAR